MKRGPENAELLETLRALDKAYAKTKKAVWKRAAELLSRPRRKRVEVNLYELDAHCSDGATAIVPGKILSIGKLSKKITVAAFSATRPAREKIAAAGAKLITLKQAADDSKIKGAKIVV